MAAAAERKMPNSEPDFRLPILNLESALDFLYVSEPLDGGLLIADRVDQPDLQRFAPGIDPAGFDLVQMGRNVLAPFGNEARRTTPATL